MTYTVEPTTPSALRLRLLELLAPHAAGRDVVELAARAEQFVLGAGCPITLRSDIDPADLAAQFRADLDRTQAVVLPAQPETPAPETPTPPVRTGAGVARRRPARNPEVSTDDRTAETPSAQAEPGPTGAGQAGAEQPQAAHPVGLSSGPGDAAADERVEPGIAPPAQAPGEAATQYLIWTPENLAELERHLAAGLSYGEIGAEFGKSAGAIAQQARKHGWHKAYPRNRRSTLLFDPVSEPPKSAAPAAAETDERSRMIADHIAAHGVTRSVDFGPDQPAVDALRRYGNTVFGSLVPQQPWLINGSARTTNWLWERANKALAERGEPAIRRAKA
ncbi:MAG: hypothetical protein AB7D00_00445 [Rhodospirillaceae bacterium]